MRTVLCSFGHVATYRELMDRFGADSAVVPFRRTGGRTTIIYVRRNVYVCGHVTSDELAAARVGAALDCVSVLARHGLPVGDAPLRHTDGTIGSRPPGRSDRDDADGSRGGCLHLRFRPGAGRASERRRAEAADIRRHWSVPRWPVVPIEAARRAAIRGTPVSRLEVPLDEALLQALTSCLTVPESLAVIRALLAAPDAHAPTHAHAPAHIPAPAPAPAQGPAHAQAPADAHVHAPAHAQDPTRAQPRRSAEQLAAVIAHAPKHVRARLLRAGLPSEVADASSRLAQRNVIYDL